jgi:methionyl aminopeptidase
MFNLGLPDTRVDPDGWTVRTVDGSLSAHFEHTVALTPDGVVVTTLAKDEKLPDLVGLLANG